MSPPCPEASTLQQSAGQAVFPRPPGSLHAGSISTHLTRFPTLEHLQRSCTSHAKNWWLQQSWSDLHMTLAPGIVTQDTTSCASSARHEAHQQRQVHTSRCTDIFQHHKAAIQRFDIRSCLWMRAKKPDRHGKSGILAWSTSGRLWNCQAPPRGRKGGEGAKSIAAQLQNQQGGLGMDCAIQCGQ